MGWLIMNCDTIRPLLSAFHDGELPPGQFDNVRRHVDECDACRAETRRLAAISQMALALRESPPPDLWGAIASQLDGAPPLILRPVRGWQLGRRPKHIRRLVWGTALAASVAVFVVVFWQWSPHVDSHHQQMDANLARFVDTFRRNPVEAQQTLQDQYASRLVEPHSLVSLVNYRSVAPEELPGGLRRASTRVFDVPCCKCVQTLYTSEGQSRLALFEHVNEESAWFATNPSINAVCCGHTIRLVQCGDGLCAAWKGDGRFITIVGAETLETLSDVIAVIEETDQPSG